MAVLFHERCRTEDQRDANKDEPGKEADDDDGQKPGIPRNKQPEAGYTWASSIK